MLNTNTAKSPHKRGDFVCLCPLSAGANSNTNAYVSATADERRKRTA